MTAARAFQIAPWLACAVASIWVGSALGASNLDLQPSIVGVGSIIMIAGLLTWARRNEAFASPFVLMGVPLLAALCAATTPLTEIATAWTTSRLAEAVGIAVAPIFGMVLARYARGRPRVSRSALAPVGDGEAEVSLSRLVAICVAMLAVGAPILAQEFASIGGPPLLSGHIDEARGILITNGPLHILTEGVSISLMIAAWALATQYRRMTAGQRAILIGVIVADLLFAVLQGGRLIVIMPVVASCVVVARHVSKRALRRGALGMGIGILLFGGVYAVVRGAQTSSEAFHARVSLTDRGTNKPLWTRAINTLVVDAGEQYRVVLEVRAAQVHSGPFHNTVFFIHRFLPRAQPSGQTALAVTRVWVTGTYALDFLLDFGLLAALVAGAVFGAVGYVLYRRYIEATNIGAIWLYGNFAGPMTLAFYTNMFTAFIFVWIDLLVVYLVARFVSGSGSAPSGLPVSV